MNRRVVRKLWAALAPCVIACGRGNGAALDAADVAALADSTPDTERSRIDRFERTEATDACCDDQDVDRARELRDVLCPKSTSVFREIADDPTEARCRDPRTETREPVRIPIEPEDGGTRGEKSSARRAADAPRCTGHGEHGSGDVR